MATGTDAIDLAMDLLEPTELLPPPAAVAPPPKSRELTNNQRQAILHRLLPHQKENGKLAKGAYKNAAVAFKVSPRTCAKIWKRYKETQDDDTCPAGDVSSNKSKCGRKPRDFAVLLESIRSIPVQAKRRSKDLISGNQYSSEQPAPSCPTWNH